AMAGVPALVLTARFDVLAWNPLGHALLAGHLAADSPRRPADRPNTQRLLFLDPHTRELYPNWEDEAPRAVSALRLAAGEYPDDRRLAELIGELSMKSAEFAALWSRHPVRKCAFGVKSFHHPLVGPMELTFEMTRLPDSSGQCLMMYGAEPGSSSEAALRLLASGVTAPSASASAATGASAAAAGAPAAPTP
ncbi:transcriptional regulator, partial [Streptomyces sp. 2MCAF27]